MAKEPEPKDQGTGTNALLAKILEVDKQILETDGKILAATLATAAAQQESAKATMLLLKVETDSKKILQDISDALTGGGDQHVFTVLVQRLADQLATKLRK